jgi:hypothetical protein
MTVLDELEREDPREGLDTATEEELRAALADAQGRAAELAAKLDATERAGRAERVELSRAVAEAGDELRRLRAELDRRADPEPAGEPTGAGAPPAA